MDPRKEFRSQRPETHEEWQARMGGEVLAVVRSGLYLDFRFLDMALSALTPAPDERCRVLATDGQMLYYQPARLLQLYQQNPKYLNRLYLHVVFHCVFRHLWLKGRREPQLWSLACDIAVENVIDSLNRASVKRPLTYVRQNAYRQITAEEKVVAAAYHRFKTSDNLFNYRAYLEEGLDDCEANYLPQLALDYARVERCAPNEAAPAVRALIQKQRDALEEMSGLMKQIDASHIRYRKRAVQRAQFLLLSDRSAQGSVTALLRRYAEEIKTPDQLFEPDDGPVAKHLHLYPVQVFGEKPLYPPAAPRSEVPLRPVETGTLDPEQLQKEQQLLLEYARMAVTEENVALLAQQALAARRQVAASTLADEYPSDFARIIGLHTYSQSPRRDYDIERTGKWVERGGFRFEEFILMPRKEEPHGRNE